MISSIKHIFRLSSDSNLVLSSIKRIFRMLPRNKQKYLLFLFIFLMISSFLDVFGIVTLIPLFSIMLNKEIVEKNEYFKFVYELLDKPSIEIFVTIFALGILFLVLSKSIFAIYIEYIKTKIAFNIYHYLNGKILKNYFYKRYDFFANSLSDVIVRNIHSVPQSFVSMVIFPLITLINELVISLIIVVGISAYDSTGIILLLCTVVPTIILLYRLIRNKVQSLNETRNEFISRITHSIRNLIFGYIDVKITNTEGIFYRRYLDLIKNDIKCATILRVYNVLPPRVTEITMTLGVISLVMYINFGNIAEENITILISSLALAAYRILPSVNRIVGLLISIKSGYHFFPIIEDALAIKPLSPPDVKEEIQFNQIIDIRNISFNYGSRKNFALQDICFEVYNGEKIGIVGGSGSGKTTLMNILLRFLKEQKGSILVDGVELQEKHTESWRNLLGYVQQSIFLTSSSLRENIAFGIDLDKIDENKLNRAVEYASLCKYVEELPNGLDTKIGEHGVLLSGGQRQRVGIARALYFEAKILFFDEATSSLDSNTERDITESIYKISNRGITMIIIAHRITTLKYCDKIIKLSNGQIEDIYTYKQLLKEELSL